jgi:hypothetical protein
MERYRAAEASMRKAMDEWRWEAVQEKVRED